MIAIQSRLYSSPFQHGQSGYGPFVIFSAISFDSTRKQIANPRYQPPKRRGAASGSASAQSQPKKARLSKLAKENDITAEEESEIKEAFRLFAITEITSDIEEYASEKEGVMRTPDVRRALM